MGFSKVPGPLALWLLWAALGWAHHPEVCSPIGGPAVWGSGEAGGRGAQLPPLSHPNLGQDHIVGNSAGQTPAPGDEDAVLKYKKAMGPDLRALVGQ